MLEKKLNYQDLLKMNNDEVSQNEKNNRDIIIRCYWCCDSNEIEMCRGCKRRFCKFCIKTINSENNDDFICFICGCFENMKEESNGKSNMGDREMMHMLNRYESLYNNSKLVRNMNSVLENIDSVSVEKLPKILELVHNDVELVLSDIEKLSIMVKQAIENNRKEETTQILLPLFKVLTKHHLFHCLGRPQNGFTACDDRNSNSHDQYKSKINNNNNNNVPVDLMEDDYDCKVEMLPTRVTEEEQFFEIVEMKEEEEIPNKLATIKKESIDYSGFQIKINISPENNSVKSPNSKQQKRQGVRTASCSEETAEESAQRAALLLAPFSFKKCSKSNPHLVAPARVAQEKSFVIQDSDKVDIMTEIPPRTQKTWSWEKSNAVVMGKSTVVRLKKNRFSANGGANYNDDNDDSTSFTLEPVPKRELLCPLTVPGDEPPRKRGRPRKYFSNFHLDIPPSLRDNNNNNNH